MKRLSLSEKLGETLRLAFEARRSLNQLITEAQTLQVAEMGRSPVYMDEVTPLLKSARKVHKVLNDFEI